RRDCGCSPVGPRQTNGLVRHRHTSPLSGQLDRGHSDSLGALRPLLDVELDALIFFERPEAARLDLRVVDEDIFRTLVRGDKAKAFVAVEPFHSSLCHLLTSLIQTGCTKNIRMSSLARIAVRENCSRCVIFGGDAARWGGGGAVAVAVVRLSERVPGTARSHRRGRAR